MALRLNKLAAATAVAAAFSLLATPAAAIELPRAAAVDVFDGEALDAERDRRRRGDRDRYRHRGRSGGISTGDVVAGALVIGAIAALAAGSQSRNDRGRDNAGYGYGTPEPYAGSDSRGIDRAVDICVSEAERGADRVGSVDGAARTAEGWRVSGEFENGALWSCAIGNDGRITDMNLGTYGYGTAPAERVEDNQWDDATYARIRAQQGSVSGPIDGDVGNYGYQSSWQGGF